MINTNVVDSVYSLSNYEQTSADHSQQLFDTRYNCRAASKCDSGTFVDQGLRDYEQIGR
jgi:hypothetical protein